MRLTNRPDNFFEKEDKKRKKWDKLKNDEVYSTGQSHLGKWIVRGIIVLIGASILLWLRTH